MSRDRDSMKEIDVGPSFDADSITIPDELRETSNFGQPSATRSATVPAAPNRSRSMWAGLIVGAAILGVGAAAILKDSEPEAASAVALKTEELVVANPSATKKAIDPEPEKKPVLKAPEPKAAPVIAAQIDAPPSPQDKPAAKAAEKVSPAPKRRSVDRPTEKPVKRKLRRKKPKRSLDDALAKLQDFEEETDQEPMPSGIEPGGNTVKATAPLTPDVACAQGDLSACVKAGQAAETNNDGAKARQFYGIACAKGRASACGNLAGLLDKGVGGPADPKRAQSIRAKACKLGHQKSCVSVKTTTSTGN